MESIGGNQNKFSRGVAILSSCLKDAGHTTSLIYISKPISKREFTDLLKKKDPDLVAFSFITTMFRHVKEFSRWVKELGIPTLHGGMHPTVAPEECLSEEGIDAVCRGEGEGAIVDFCRALEAKGDINDIRNIWTRENDHIHKNPCRELVEDLDSLPYPDYEVFDYENLEEGRIRKTLATQASRGCVYNCTYCCNPLLRSLYPNKKRFLRHYSVDRLLDEIEWGLKKYPFSREVRFYDDTLAQDKKWFKEFVSKYKERISLPYSGNERVENITPETAVEFKKSGCTSLDLGIESGSKVMREKYMNRYMSNEKIADAFVVLRSHGIRGNAFNILGMVGETPQTALQTIKLNAAVKPNIAFNAYFYPFKGTEAYDLVKENKYRIQQEKVSGFFERPVVTLDTISEAQLTYFYKYFLLLMRAYRILWRLSGKDGYAEKTVDRIITSKYFPYKLFNFVHVGKEDVIASLRKRPGFYSLVRTIYRFVKREKT